jgi:sulfur-carrier protein adenylyltransferase/sulfurtransferase
MSLTKEDIKRYSRQIILKNVGESGQLKIKKSSVLIVGVGGLGSPAALYLAAAGIGRIGLIDFDVIDISNLQRQILYASEQEGQSKAEVAKKRLKELNPLIQIDAYPERLTIKNALGLFEKYDYILDGADNFSTRYLVNDASYFSSKPLISASIMGFEGQLSVFNRNHGPCYRCLYPEPPHLGSVQSCAEAGVLGVLPAVMGSLQATEVLKLILDLNQNQSNQLLIYDALTLNFTNLEIEKNSDCPLCGQNPMIKELNEVHFVCNLNNDNIEEISPTELKKHLIEKNIQLLDVRENFEHELGYIEFSLHVPLNEIEHSWSKLSQETPVVIYCKSGQRSLQACQILAKKGFRCMNLQGGFFNWTAQGF